MISEIYNLIFQSKFDKPSHRDGITEKSGTSKKIQWDFQISRVGSLDFLDLKVNGSPGVTLVTSVKIMPQSQQLKDFTTIPHNVFWGLP